MEQPAEISTRRTRTRRTLKDGPSPACKIHASLGNIWRFKAFRHLYEQPPQMCSPTDILNATGAPSYFIVQRSLHILMDNGLVEHRSRSGGRSYFGLTDKGRWVADVVGQLDDLTFPNIKT